MRDNTAIVIWVAIWIFASVGLVIAISKAKRQPAKKPSGPAAIEITDEGVVLNNIIGGDTTGISVFDKAGNRLPIETRPMTGFKSLPIADFEDAAGNTFTGSSFVVPDDMPDAEAYRLYGWPKPEAEATP